MEGIPFRPESGVGGQIKKELRWHSTVKAVIGHLKTGGHDRNFLKRCLGEAVDAVITAVGYNCRLVLD